MKTISASSAPGSCLEAATVSKGYINNNLALPSDAFDLVSEYLPFHDTAKAMQFAPSIFVPTPQLEKSLIFYLAIQYLPLRDLSAMAMVSKSSRSSITTDVVVRSAYMQTGNRFCSRKSMEELYNLMSGHKIHIPSPLRLFRIATGNKCEFCLTTRIRSVSSWSNGVFACWNCITSKRKYGGCCLSKAWNTGYVRYGKNSNIYDCVLNLPRNVISQQYGKKYYLWAERRTVTGELVGPIIAWEDIDGMVNSIMNNMGKADSSISADDYIDNQINTYMNDICKAPAVDEYNEFNIAYLTVKQDVDERTERANREKIERSRLREEKKRKREAEQQAKEERKRQREVIKQVREHDAGAAAVAGTDAAVNASGTNAAADADVGN
ncbi:hypothetical protein ACHAWU_000504 [Discostella pseudostelligera]|uniref:F-box domain-containing protein n=1 Tax=Discostella pseudostelligera TaxID=259834 RepID=A0ABD3MLI8_9STRA